MLYFIFKCSAFDTPSVRKYILLLFLAVIIDLHIFLFPTTSPSLTLLETKTSLSPYPPYSLLAILSPYITFSLL